MLLRYVTRDFSNHLPTRGFFPTTLSFTGTRLFPLPSRLRFSLVSRLTTNEDQRETKDQLRQSLSDYAQKKNQKASNMPDKTESRAFHLPPRSYLHMIESAGKVGKFDQIREKLQEMKSRSIPITERIRCHVIKMLGKHGKTDQIQSFLDEMFSAQIPVLKSTHSTILEAYATNNQLDKMVEYFNQLKADGNLATSYYNAMIGAYGSRLMMAEMFQCVSEMKKNQVPLSPFTYQTLIKACRKRGLLQEASFFFKEMQTTQFANPGLVYHQRIDSAHNTTQMIRIFEEMKQNMILETRNYNHFLNRLATRTSDMRTMNTYLQEMKNENLQPDEKTYLPFLKLLLQQEKADELLKLFEELKRSDIPVSALSYNVMIMWARHNRDLNKMNEYFEEMKAASIPFDAMTYNLYLFYLAKQKSMEQANAVLQEMKTHGIRPAEFTYEAMLIGLCERDFPEMLRYWKEMKDRNIQPTPRSFASVLKGFMLNSDWDGFRETLLEAKATHKDHPLIYALEADAYGAFDRQDLLPGFLQELNEHQLSTNPVVRQALIATFLRFRMIHQTLSILLASTEEWTPSLLRAFFIFLREEHVPQDLQKLWKYLKYESKERNTLDENYKKLVLQFLRSFMEEEKRRLEVIKSL